MKLLKIFCAVFVIGSLQGCGGGMVKNSGIFSDSSKIEASAVRKVVMVPKANTNLIVDNKKDLLGYWVGMFEPDTDIAAITAGEQYAWNYENKITISIDEIDSNLVMGHSVVAGNDRPFTGKLTMVGPVFHFSVKEPGDDKYDGTFEFYISKKDSIFTGTWKANNKIRIAKRKYNLTKKVFRYDANCKLREGNHYIDWIKSKKVSQNDPHYRGYDDSYFTTTDDLFKYNASADSLTIEQVSNLKKADIFILRNSIYARHGYSFKNQQLRAYFDRENWYIPVSVDVKSELTLIEKKNIQLLMRYEKNAKEYYDVFGRG